MSINYELHEGVGLSAILITRLAFGFRRLYGIKSRATSTFYKGGFFTSP